MRVPLQWHAAAFRAGVDAAAAELDGQPQRGDTLAKARLARSPAVIIERKMTTKPPIFQCLVANYYGSYRA
ncbi:MAG: hypothetical protein AB7U97_27270, partial [Pirellulales bacterium]